VKPADERAESQRSPEYRDKLRTEVGGQTSEIRENKRKPDNQKC